MQWNGVGKLYSYLAINTALAYKFKKIIFLFGSNDGGQLLSFFKHWYWKHMFTVTFVYTDYCPSHVLRFVLFIMILAQSLDVSAALKRLLPYSNEVHCNHIAYHSSFKRTNEHCSYICHLQLPIGTDCYFQIFSTTCIQLKKYV